MFTLRFETDPCGDGDDGLVSVVAAPRYRVVRHKDGSADVLVPNEQGVDVAHPVGEGLGSHHRCYVMNAAGQTVDRIRPASGASPQRAVIGGEAVDMAPLTRLVMPEVKEQADRGGSFAKAVGRR